MRLRFAAVAASLILLVTATTAPKAGEIRVLELNAFPTHVDVGQQARWVASVAGGGTSGGELSLILPGATTALTYTVTPANRCLITEGNPLKLRCAVETTPVILVAHGVVGFGASPLVSRASFESNGITLEAIDFQFINGIRSTYFPLVIH